MRMRKKKNLAPRMERCSHLLVNSPERLKGRWLSENINAGEVWLEIGCGKGRFTAELAASEPKVLLVAVERVPDAMVTAMERASARSLDNVRFILYDARILGEIFGISEVSRIFINFCDPWPGTRQAKRRLTSGGFLELYLNILAPGGEIHFKTDNRSLFEYSLEEFESRGFSLSEVTEDLHGEGVTGIVTDYEAKFHSEGKKICRCVAKKGDGGC